MVRSCSIKGDDTGTDACASSTTPQQTPTKFSPRRTRSSSLTVQSESRAAVGGSATPRRTPPPSPRVTTRRRSCSSSSADCLQLDFTPKRSKRLSALKQIDEEHDSVFSDASDCPSVVEVRPRTRKSLPSAASEKRGVGNKCSDEAALKKIDEERDGVSDVSDTPSIAKLRSKSRKSLSSTPVISSARKKSLNSNIPSIVTDNVQTIQEAIAGNAGEPRDMTDSSRESTSEKLLNRCGSVPVIDITDDEVCNNGKPAADAANSDSINILENVISSSSAQNNIFGGRQESETLEVGSAATVDSTVVSACGDVSCTGSQQQPSSATVNSEDAPQEYNDDQDSESFIFDPCSPQNDCASAEKSDVVGEVSVEMVTSLSSDRTADSPVGVTQERCGDSHVADLPAGVTQERCGDSHVVDLPAGVTQERCGDSHVGDRSAGVTQESCGDSHVADGPVGVTQERCEDSHVAPGVLRALQVIYEFRSTVDDDTSVENVSFSIDLSPVPRGVPKSRRPWKQVRTKVSTVRVQESVSYEVRMQKLRQLKEVKQLEQRLRDEKQRQCDELKRRREFNKKRTAEKALKGEVYQVIKNPNKVKRMKKKQLRLLQKRDTTVVER